MYTTRLHAYTQVVRSSSGETRAYPLVDAVQKDSICYTTLAPAAVPLHTAAAAQALASQVSSIESYNIQHHVIYAAAAANSGSLV
jgi:ATP-grasp domain